MNMKQEQTQLKKDKNKSMQGKGFEHMEIKIGLIFSRYNYRAND